jgi:hypothetical protein
MTAPERSRQQRITALESANATRTFRAGLKRDLKATPHVRATHRVAAIVRDPPPLLLSMKAGELMLTVPAIGTVKAGKMLRKLAIAPSKTLGGLSIRQRFMLAEALDALAVMRQFPAASVEYQRLARASVLVG